MKAINDFKHYLKTTVKEQLLLEFPLIKNQIEEIVDFVSKGKLKRSELCLNLFNQFENNKEKELLLVCFIEFFQSTLLIHDDVMDSGINRRGSLSFNTKYGNNYAICIGDISFCITNFFLSKLKLKYYLHSKIHYLMCQVMFGQILDLQQNKNNLKNIIDTFKYKTGSYTFSIPLLLGLSPISLDFSDIDMISELGYNLGVIFQIYDDFLGIYEFHKDKNNNDIEENKDTLFKYFLYQNYQKDELDSIFGIKNYNRKTLENLLKKHQILSKVSGISDFYKQKTFDNMKNLSNLDINFTYIKDILKKYTNFDTNFS